MYTVKSLCVLAGLDDKASAIAATAIIITITIATNELERALLLLVNFVVVHPLRFSLRDTIIDNANMPAVIQPTYQSSPIKRAVKMRCHQSVKHAIAVDAAVTIITAVVKNLKKPLGTAPIVSPKYQYLDAGTSWNVSGESGLLAIFTSRL